MLPHAEAGVARSALPAKEAARRQSMLACEHACERLFIISSDRDPLADCVTHRGRGRPADGSFVCMLLNMAEIKERCRADCAAHDAAMRARVSGRLITGTTSMCYHSTAGTAVMGLLWSSVACVE